MQDSHYPGPLMRDDQRCREGLRVAVASRGMGGLYHGREGRVQHYNANNGVALVLLDGERQETGFFARELAEATK